MASRHAGGSSIGNGRYEIREHIATGGMATVYKAWDTRVERIVAIKVLRSLAKSDSNAVERFRQKPCPQGKSRPAGAILTATTNRGAVSD